MLYYILKNLSLCFNNVVFTFRWYFGSCQNLRHIDLSGCDKISDLALERLSLALGVLPSFRKDLFRCSRNIKNVKSAWGRKDLTNRMRTNTMQCIGGQCGLFPDELWTRSSRCDGYPSSPFWILHSERLADIEDAADWKYGNTDGLCVLEMSSSMTCFANGCCIRKPMPGMRTNGGWQQRYQSDAYTYCGHSFCSAGAKLRTIQALPEPSAPCKGGKRTPKSEVTDSFSGSAKSGPSAARVLQFLSLSGCHQITDRGLRLVLITFP